MSGFLHGVSVPRWVWAVGGAAVALVVAGLVWSASGSAPERAEPVDVERSVASFSAATPAVNPHSAPGAAVRITPKHRLEAKTAAPGSRPACPRAVVTPITPRAMFPMGDVTRGLPLASVQLYRPSSEPFPSFGYGAKIWDFSGRYVGPEKVDLVPTGLRLGGRKLFALANTAGPGTALFLQSSKDPGKFAVYRSPCVDKRCVWR
jgi:hypothetical protein